MEDRTVIPGLIDNHVHYLRSSPYWRFEAFWDGVSTRERAVKIIEEKVESSLPGDWVMTIGGWDPGQFTDSQANFSLTELDLIAPQNPVFIQAGFSGGYANSLALDIIGRASPGVDLVTGFISSAIDGKYAGVPEIVRLSLPEYDEESWKTEYLAKMNEDYNKAGITAVWNAGAIHYDNEFSKWSEEYVDDNSGWSNVRIFHHIKSNAISPADLTDVVNEISNWPEIEENSYFRYLGFGEIPYMRTYDMTSSGWNPTQQDLSSYKTVIEAVAEKGWQLSEHMMLNEKFDDVLSIFEEIDGQVDLNQLRWTFHHCYGIDQEQIERAKELSVFLAMQNSPAMAGGSVARNFSSNSPPFRAAQQSGIKWGLGSDAKIVSPYPAFFTLYFAVTGKDASGKKVLFNQTVTREEALIAHSRSNAYYLFEEENLGSLEIGKYADLVVLDKDYLTIPEDEIKELHSVLTLVGGKIGYIDESSIILEVDENSEYIPKNYKLFENYPNPFNPQTTISFNVPVESKVKIEIFNLLGASVDLILDNFVSAGHHEIKWNAQDRASGFYICRMSTKNFVQSNKILLLK